MPARAPSPGHDEIIVAAVAGRHLCSSREHARLGRLAEVIVVFGELGTRWHKDALWQDLWSRSFVLCGECWQAARQVAESRRPGLVVTQASRPAQAAGAPDGVT
jgi:hypothetical protein